MPVKRTRISRRQSLPTISEAHGAISSFPAPEIKTDPQFRRGSMYAPEFPPLIERDDLKESRERRMGRRTKEEREARKKAKKEKRRAEKKRAKELDADKDETSTTSDGINSDPKASSSASRSRPTASPIVSLDEALKKREQMQAKMDISKLPMPPVTDDSEADTDPLGETSPSAATVPIKMSELTGPGIDTKRDELITSSATPTPIAATTYTSVSLPYERNEHKLQVTKMSPIDACETKSFAKPLVDTRDGKQLAMSMIDGNETTSDGSKQTQGSSETVERRSSFIDIFEGMSPEEMEETVLELIQMEDDEDAETKAEMEVLLNELMPQIKSESTIAEVEKFLSSVTSDRQREETTTVPTAISTIQKPSELEEPLMLATKGPYARRGSFNGSLDELTVEISQSSSDNDSDGPQVRHLVDEESDANNVYDSEYSDGKQSMERNMRRINIRRPSAAAGARSPPMESSDDENIASSSTGATSDRPMLARRESKSNLRQFRQGPQMLTTSAFGIVRLSDQHTLESSFIRDEEGVVSDDDIFVHAIPINVDHNPRNGNGEEMHQAVATAGGYTRYDARSSEQERFSAHGSSEFIVEEQKVNQRSWIMLIVLLFVPALSVAVYFAVASALNEPVPAAQTPTQSPIGDNKYDPPSSEDCRIIENGGALDGEGELIRRDFDLLMDVELADGFSLNGPNGLLPSLQEGADKHLVPHLAGCDDVPRDRLLRREQSRVQTSRLLHNVRYVIANVQAIVSLDETRSCEEDASANCYPVKLSLQLKLKGEEKNFPIAKVLHHSVDENNSLIHKLKLSAPFTEVIVTDINPVDASTEPPTDNPSSAPTIQSSPSSAPTNN